jgi:hypothetical protein
MALAQVGGKIYSNTALAETKAAAVTSRCLVFNFLCVNPDATTISYLQFFDLASADVTVGTTTPTFVMALSPKTGYNIGLTCPVQFTTAMTVANTSTPTGNGAPATAAVVSLHYVSG